MAEGGYLLFLPRATGYSLVERDGEPPAVGAELEEDGVRLRVTKLGPSPLPGDRRRCVFAETA